MVKVLGPKTKRYLALKGLHPDTRAVVQAQLDTLDDIAAGHGKSAAQKAVDSIKGALQATLNGLYEKAQEAIDVLPEKMFAEFKRMARERINSLPHLKGDPGDNGKTPEKGVDYEDGYTPQPDIDYPSNASFDRRILEAEGAIYKKLAEAGMTRPQIQETMAELFKKLDFAAIARGLEKLEGKARLSYTALKDTPAVQAQQHHGRTIHRGGGTTGGRETYYYDLSDLCNGVTKAFAIPSNIRVLEVVGTDTPAGTYRPLVDWTGSGTELLTLTNEVAAPTQGSTLYILYVQ